jgi:hypothetical protein
MINPSNLNGNYKNQEPAALTISNDSFVSMGFAAYDFQFKQGLCA